MRNVLFVLYYDFSANSAIHVHNFANRLAESGHGVAVAVPKNKETGVNLGEQSYTAVNYHEVDGEWANLFANGKPPEIVHAWTPREIVRLFCEKLAGLCQFALVVHLEDNEEQILEVNLGLKFEKLAASRSIEVPIDLSHPRNYRRFLASASGVTLIMDRLEEFVPDHIPRMILWPGADSERFYPRPKDVDYLTSLGVPPQNTVLCYAGNVHSSNAHEVRSLYGAVAMLNREGFPTTLVRAGRDHCPFLGTDDKWARQHSVELGYVRHVDIPQVMNLADVLVQPGKADPFNDYRLPSKLPEFFAMGRPVVLPATNVGRFVRHGEHAWVLLKVDALGIIETVEMLLSDRALTQRLSDGALRFREEHFSWKANVKKLADFYEQLIPARAAAG